MNGRGRGRTKSTKAAQDVRSLLQASARGAESAPKSDITSPSTSLMGTEVKQANIITTIKSEPVVVPLNDTHINQIIKAQQNPRNTKTMAVPNLNVVRKKFAGTGNVNDIRDGTKIKTQFKPNIPYSRKKAVIQTEGVFSAGGPGGAAGRGGHGFRMRKEESTVSKHSGATHKETNATLGSDSIKKSLSNITNNNVNTVDLSSIPIALPLYRDVTEKQKELDEEAAFEYINKTPVQADPSHSSLDPCSAFKVADGAVKLIYFDSFPFQLGSDYSSESETKSKHQSGSHHPATVQSTTPAPAQTEPPSRPIGGLFGKLRIRKNGDVSMVVNDIETKLTITETTDQVLIIKNGDSSGSRGSICNVGKLDMTATLQIPQL